MQGVERAWATTGRSLEMERPPSMVASDVIVVYREEGAGLEDRLVQHERSERQ
jgi:hypothetical protein